MTFTLDLENVTNERDPSPQARVTKPRIDITEYSPGIDINDNLSCIDLNGNFLAVGVNITLWLRVL